MKLFITGGSGFLGTRLTKKLIRDGHEITAFARSDLSAEKLSQLGCKTVVADLLSSQSYEEYLKDINVVIHAASPVSFWGEWSYFQKNIVDATRNLFEAANRNNVKRFIYISSESVIQNDTPLLDIDETFPYIEPNSFYGKAKQLTERWLIEQNSQTECIIFRPTFMWGPNVAAIATMKQKIEKGQFVWIDHGDVVIESVHVDNVVHAISLALTKGENKQIYYVTDDAPRAVKVLISQLLDTQNIHAPEKSVPTSLAKGAAITVEALWKMLHIKSPPPLSKFEWSFVALPRRYNISKIQNSLGYEPVTSFEQGLDEMRLAKQKEASIISNCNKSTKEKENA